MKRFVQPEQLDELPADDPLATGSRKDLRRINTLMGNARLSARAIHTRPDAAAPRRVVDAGAGDGTLLLQLLRHLPGLAPGLELVLVDRTCVVDDRVLDACRKRGFKPRVEQADVLNWLRASPSQPGTWLLANLFLHHFAREPLEEFLDLASERCALVCACEPRRAWWPLVLSRLLWFIGANAVTRHDAVISVRAGFAGRELSALWPRTDGWHLSEYRAGLFSHLFLAQQVGMSTEHCRD